MREERTITQFGRVPVQKLWWSAIFGGTLFALGIMLILSFFGVAVGAAIAGAGAKVWAGIWSLVTLFVGFFAGGWLAARASGSMSKPDGRMHGLVVWALGSVALFYFAVTGTTRIAAALSNLGGANIQSLTAAPGTVANATTTAAIWLVISSICGLVGGVLGGHSGGYTYREAEAEEAPPIRRAA